jgi:hypothetical protein
MHVPKELCDGLPGTIVEYNRWLEDALAYKNGNVTVEVKTFMGFIMGFRKDHPLHEPETNRFIHAGRNAHQVHSTDLHPRTRCG